MVLPAAKVGFSATAGLLVDEPPPPPQALRVSARAADAATTKDFRRVINAFMTYLSLVAAGNGLGANSVGANSGI